MLTKHTYTHSTIELLRAFHQNDMCGLKWQLVVKTKRSWVIFVRKNRTRPKKIGNKNVNLHIPLTIGILFVCFLLRRFCFLYLFLHLLIHDWEQITCSLPFDWCKKKNSKLYTVFSFLLDCDMLWNYSPNRVRFRKELCIQSILLFLWSLISFET